MADLTRKNYYKLQMKLVSGKDIPIGDIVSSDPYVELMVFSESDLPNHTFTLGKSRKGKQPNGEKLIDMPLLMKSTVQKSTLNPKWGPEPQNFFEIDELGGPDEHFPSIYLRLWDYDKVGSHDFLGDNTIEIGKKFFGEYDGKLKAGPQEVSFLLNNTPKKGCLGSLTFEGELKECSKETSEEVAKKMTGGKTCYELVEKAINAFKESYKTQLGETSEEFCKTDMDKEMADALLGDAVMKKRYEKADELLKKIETFEKNGDVEVAYRMMLTEDSLLAALGRSINDRIKEFDAYLERIEKILNE